MFRYLRYDECQSSSGPLIRVVLFHFEDRQEHVWQVCSSPRERWKQGERMLRTIF